MLDDLSLSIEAGEGLAILGRNGVGKTTLMLAIMGYARRFGGDLRFAGASFTHLAPSQRVPLGLGWVPRERDIFPVAHGRGEPAVAARPGRVGLAEVYRLFPRLNERRRNMGDKLSGGEQQMLAIGRKLMINPRLLLLDEPFEGLAPVSVERSKRRCRRCGASSAIVEQHAEDALRLSDRAIILDRGRIVLEDKAGALLNDFDRVQSWIAV